MDIIEPGMLKYLRNIKKGIYRYATKHELLFNPKTIFLFSLFDTLVVRKDRVLMLVWFRKLCSSVRYFIFESYFPLKHGVLRIYTNICHLQYLNKNLNKSFIMTRLRKKFSILFCSLISRM